MELKKPCKNQKRHFVTFSSRQMTILAKLPNVIGPVLALLFSIQIPYRSQKKKYFHDFSSRQVTNETATTDNNTCQIAEYNYPTI